MKGETMFAGSMHGSRRVLTLIVALAAVVLTFAVQVIHCEGGHACNGTAQRDSMLGTNSVDKMSGRGGKDTINAGGGDDTVMADDGQLDSISCGTGTDVVFVDQEDLDAEGTDFEDFVRLTSCETINEPEPSVEG